MLWLRLAGLRHIDPADDVSVGIRLDRLERHLADAAGQRVSGDREVLELTWHDLSARPDDLRDRLAERPVVGRDRLLQRDGLHRGSPADNRLDEQLRDRMIGWN